LLREVVIIAKTPPLKSGKEIIKSETRIKCRQLPPVLQDGPEMKGALLRYVTTKKLNTKVLSTRKRKR
jgi:hypothetical protein